MRFRFPWEALPKIGAFILVKGATLSPEEYDRHGEDIWIAKRRAGLSFRLYCRSGNYRPRDGGPPVRIYPGKAWSAQTAS